MDSLWHQGRITTYVLLLSFFAVGLWEIFRPAADPPPRLARRWTSHTLLWIACNICLVGLYRTSGVLMALSLPANRVLSGPWMPLALRCALAILLLDLLKYAVHRLYHAVPVLWRIHALHHSDGHFDWSTGFRFHPLEVLFTQGAYLAAIFVLGPPAIAVLALELAGVFVDLFSHANAALPSGADRKLRRLLVTPAMHRVHHSGSLAEQNTNFGIVFPWWDRLFGTYHAASAAAALPTGDGRTLSLPHMLALPFRRP